MKTIVVAETNSRRQDWWLWLDETGSKKRIEPSPSYPGLSVHGLLTSTLKPARLSLIKRPYSVIPHKFLERRHTPTLCQGLGIQCLTKGFFKEEKKPWFLVLWFHLLLEEMHFTFWEARRIDNSLAKVGLSLCDVTSVIPWIGNRSLLGSQ